MKSILISIKPEWVEKILNGEKTIEIRKTIPKCELPCKVYIYCTKDNGYKLLQDNETGQYFKGITSGNETIHPSDTEYGMNCEYEIQCCTRLNGKVIAEFTLNKIEKFTPYWDEYDYRLDYDDLKKTCLTRKQIGYYGKGKNIYAWHIDNLKIYDRPKKLDTFIIGKVALDCGYGNYNIYNKVVKRPPQSWCYVEGE